MREDKFLDRAGEHFVLTINQKRLWIFFILFLDISFCFASSEQMDVSFLTESEQAWLRKHPVLRLGIDAMYSPIEFSDFQGQYSGIAGNYVSILEKKLGIRFKLVHYQNRNDLLNGLRSHEADVAPAMARTSERSKYILFTDPYVYLPLVIIARQSVTESLNLDGLSGMRVSIVQSHAIEHYLRQHYPTIKLDPVDTVEMGLKKVSFGVVDAYVGDVATVTYWITKTQITNLRIAGETGMNYEICFGVRNDWSILRSILDKTLKQIPEDENEAIFRKWVRLEPLPIISNRQLLIGILIALTVVGLLLALFFAWTRSLKRMVHQRTMELNHELAERRRAEDEVRKLNNELESRVSARTAELAMANKELESFSYSVSHDLRTPLRSLDGFSQILLENYGPQLDEQGKNHLNRIRAASQRMAQLIDDMIKLARITRDRMEITKIDLSRMATSIFYEIQQNYPGRKIEMVIEPGLEVRADEVLMEVALRNLLENACKFTQKIPVAKIEFGSEVVDETRAYFVRDNGVGFNMAYVAKLFKPFQRLHTDEEFEGTGIGLAIVQRVISRHGGRVWALGEEDKGARFYFTLG
jgi:signal transduction histidine kinase